MASYSSDDILYEIDVDFYNKSQIRTVYTKQYDENTRFIIATVWKDGDVYNIPENAIAVFSCTKPDGRGVFNQCTIEDGKIVYQITAQTTIKEGTFGAEFRLYSSVTDNNNVVTQKRLTSPSFNMWVDKSELNDDTIISTDEFNTLTNLISSIGDLTADVNEAVDNANNAIDEINSTNTTVQNAEMARKVFESYNNTKTYVIGNKVSYQGSSYVCILQTTGNIPTNTTYWLLIASKGDQGVQGIQGIQGVQGVQGIQGIPGVNWMGIYSNVTTYSVRDAVSYNGSSYYCILNSTGNIPTDTTHWNVLAAKGTDGAGGDMFKNIYDLNNKATDVYAYADNNISQSNQDTVGSGVIYNSGLIVSAQSTPNMTVSVTTGVAILPDGKRYTPTANSSITVTAANSTNPRKDIIYVNSSGAITYLAGTAASSPTAPSLPSGGTLLAEIYVGAGVTSITSANITDKRTIIQSNADLVGSINDLDTNKLDKSNLSTATTGQVLTRKSDGTAEFQTIDTGNSNRYARALGTKLSASVENACILVQGDSTGNGTDEWVYQSMLWLASKTPKYTFLYKLWDDATQKYGVTTVLQTGTFGNAYALFIGTSGNNITAPDKTALRITGDIDISAKVLPDAWAQSVDQIVVSKFGVSGNRGYALGIDSTGHPYVWVSNDGTNNFTMVSTAAVSSTTPIWIRGTLDVDNGSSGKTATFYTSTDGTTWTTLGTAVTTAGTTTIYASTAALEIGSRTGATVGFYSGRIYEVVIKNGINGTIVANPKFVYNTTFPYTDTQSNTYSLTGSDTKIATDLAVTVLNASHPGAAIAYSLDNTRFGLQTPLEPQLSFISYSHNEGTNISYQATYESLCTKLLTKYPNTGIVCVTQNPQATPVIDTSYQSIRCGQIALAAAKNDYGLIDVFKAFMDTGNYTSYVSVDGVHPNANGFALWISEVEKFLKPSVKA